jgi:DNA-binding XRE family transcriptional regulator
MVNNVKKIRNKLGMTKKNFSQLLDLAYVTVCNWEAQGKNPSLKNCYKIIELCRHNRIKISVQDILPPD